MNKTTKQKLKGLWSHSTHSTDSIPIGSIRKVRIGKGRIDLEIKIDDPKWIPFIEDWARQKGILVASTSAPLRKDKPQLWVPIRPGESVNWLHAGLHGEAVPR